MANVEMGDRFTVRGAYTDETIAVARAHGVDHLVRLTNNKGLATGFQAGIDTALTNYEKGKK